MKNKEDKKQIVFNLLLNVLTGLRDYVTYLLCVISIAGYAPSMAFDNNPESLWISNGAAPPGMQWIGYEFPHPVFIGSVQIATEEDKPDRLPSLMYVEASCEKYFRNFVTQWVIFNPEHSVDKRYSGRFDINLIKRVEFFNCYN